MADLKSYTNHIVLDGHSLTLAQIEQFLSMPVGEIKISLDSKAKEKMKKSRDYVLKIVAEGKPVYGINTGFGALSNKNIAQKDLAQLQVNLIRSHCTGIGKPFSERVTRTIMLIRTNCLVSGYSGINPEIVDLLMDFINYGITPVVPEKGSVGASGDLAPLSHIALALIGEGEVFYRNQRMTSAEAMQMIHKRPVQLGPKDGLALINGTAVMNALAVTALIDAQKLMKISDLAGALTVDGIKGTTDAFYEGISNVRPHAGQLAVAENLRKLLAQSEIRESHRECDKVQDAYSLRCMPQVHGACRQTVRHALEVVGTELNSVTDNPLVFVDEEKVLSGGNFHGETLALVMDYMALGMAELCSISERRVEKMMNPTFSGQAPFLVPSSGLNSGLMIAHVTHAALTSENKVLCHPASVDSIPTSTDKEDHVSMGPNAGRKLHVIIENLKYCLAIELLCNTQAIETYRPQKSSPVLENVIKVIRKVVPPIDQDRVFAKDIENIVKLIESNELLKVVENQIGELK